MKSQTEQLQREKDTNDISPVVFFFSPKNGFCLLHAEHVMGEGREATAKGGMGPDKWGEP